MSTRRHAIAKAHADMNAAIRLTSAFNAFEAALKNERTLLLRKLSSPQDQLADRAWRKSIDLLAASLGRLDAAIVLLEDSARLQRSLVS